MSVELSIVSVARLRIERGLAELDIAARELLSVEEHETTGGALRMCVNDIRADVLADLLPEQPTCTDPAADGQMRPRQK